MSRPDGVTKQTNIIEVLTSAMAARENRAMISGKIRGQANLSPIDAERPSAHLRWALQKLKLRGWTNEQWGELFVDWENGEEGQGPICILESVRAPFDSPSDLKYEALEQKYLRLAFKSLYDDGIISEIPLYVSIWNDAQQSFEPIETVMQRAIDLAEADERSGHGSFIGKDQEELMAMFGITADAIHAVMEEQKAAMEAQERAATGFTPDLKIVDESR